MDARKYLAELVGTFILVVIGSMTIVAAGRMGTPIQVVVPFGFGLGLLAAIQSAGYVSGGHFNPAVTLGAAIGGRTAWRDVLPYWLAQFVGAALAGLVLLATTPQGAAQLEWLAQNGLITEATRAAVFSGTANGFGEHSPLAGLTGGNLEFSFASALLVEVVVTAIFVGVILGVTDKRVNSKVAPFAIGLTLSALLLVAAPVTNGSLNPARSLASAILAQPWALEQFWQLFLWGPLLGAAIAGLFYRAFAFAPAQDDLLGEDQVVVTEDLDAPGVAGVAGTTAGTTAGAAAVAEAQQSAPAETEVVEVTEVVEEVETPAAETPATDEGPASDDADGTQAPKA